MKNNEILALISQILKLCHNFFEGNTFGAKIKQSASMAKTLIQVSPGFKKLQELSTATGHQQDISAPQAAHRRWPRVVPRM